ncbi:MAG: sulfurtransferase [Anaerolineales bacterium]|nr:sulfurtransferase [Anaerolineales bacterium]
MTTEIPILVSTAWLADHLTDPDLRIVDIRGHVLPATEPFPHYFNHHADYLKTHIPGAVFVDWVHAITDPADPRHAQIAKPERFAEAMGCLGISENTYVVAYDDAGGMFAARLWWALNYYGHPRVSVLDGGWTAWMAEGRPVTADSPAMTPSVFSPTPTPHWYRDGAAVLARLGGEARLVDMRTIAEFQGSASRAARKGHIPGAVNQPRADLVQPDGRLRPAEDIRQKFAALGVSEASPEVIFYCNGGTSASFGLMALKAAGIKTAAAIYDGSWKDWGNDPTKPIEGLE